MSGTHRILVAYGGSPGCDRAFSEALDIATRESAAVYVRTVLAPIIEPANGQVDSRRESNAERGTVLSKRAAAQGVWLDVDSIYGLSPPQALADEAIRLGATLIVMGHQRRSALARLGHVSTAKRVIDCAPCRVLVVPWPMGT
jgi:nucleotide-binding universal stress UspA family protein